MVKELSTEEIEPYKCSNCGERISINDNSCPHCGTPTPKDVIHHPKITNYESEAIKDIQEWKNPDISKFKTWMTEAAYPLEKLSDLVQKIPGFNWVLEKSIGGLVSLLNDVAQKIVRKDAIYKDIGSVANQEINSPEDIFYLDLKSIDKAIGFLSAKYKAIAAAEGAITGVLGLPGIPIDIVSLITLNLRAIGEYATYYGFDVSTQQERIFVTNILSFASSPNDAAKTIAMAELVKISGDVAKKKTWKVLEKRAFVIIIRGISEALGRRLTKAKLAQFIPISGAIIGGGFNAYFTNKVCDAAYFLYRERFLAEKYGSNIIDKSSDPEE